ncbi:MAG: histidinol-phosphate transaminase [Terriglobales bacterium]
MLKPRSSIEALCPYRSPIVSRAGLALDLNENAAGCSPAVLARLRTLTAEEVAHYPRREEGERLAAKYLNIPPEQVLLTNGIDEALALLFSAYLQPGDALLFADPTFVMYAIQGQARGANVIRLASAENLALPVDEFLRRISPRTRVIAIANPNNPTGLIAARADLLRIVQAVPNAAVLVDEAYFEFCGETLIEDLPQHPNLFIARTFSKAYGLAGLRLGVLMGAADQIDFIRRLSQAFNVNAAALACLEAAIADQDFMRDSVAQARNSCREIENLCAQLGLVFWPSSANFVLVRVGKSAAAFVAAMLERGIFIRNMSANPGCEGCVRITAPARAHLDQVLQAMRESMKELNWNIALQP